MGATHTLVSMRMIGHEILLHSGDSVSLVLPIEKEGDQSKIRFESDFQFSSEKLVSAIDSIVKITGIATSYIVEVEKCGTGEVVYSYEIGNPGNADVVPCGTRMQSKGCYSIIITILEAAAPDLANGSATGKHQAGSFIIALLVCPM